MFARPLDRDIGRGVDAVLAQQVLEGVLRGRAASGGVDGTAGEVGDALDGVAGLHDVEHTERVHAEHLDFAFGFLIERRRKVRGHAEDIEVALDELRSQLVGGACEREFVAVGKRPDPGGILAHGRVFRKLDAVRCGEVFKRAVGIHEADEAHAGGALERAHAHGGHDVVRRRFAACVRARISAGSESKARER